MLSIQPFHAYSLLHREYYENIELYEPSDKYSAVVKSFLDESWGLRLRGFWSNCYPAEFKYLPHGWKIHLSAVPATAEETLKRTIPLVASRGIAFKFVSDEFMLRTSLSKNWARSGAGKFVTIYPRSIEEFKELIQALWEATQDMRGPYILSDRPYKDSRVVYYRYGEHVATHRPDAAGNLQSVLEAPDGSMYFDERVPYFKMPPWVEDPFTTEAPLEKPGEDGVQLKDGRYRVYHALNIGAMGGIYLAFDNEMEKDVVIREARPMMGSSSDKADTFSLLRKEARILQKLGPTGYTPKFFDIFQEWEHLFLVQELLDAETLWGGAINFYYRRADLTPRDAFEPLRETILRLIQGLRVVHSHGVVLRDLTRTNVMITEEGEIRFIDLEFAYELEGEDNYLFVQTPGFASPDQLKNLLPSPQDDYYALGVLILDIVSFFAAGMDLNRDAIIDSFELHLRELRLPLGLRKIVEGLTALDAEERWDLDRVEQELLALPLPPAEGLLFQQLGAVPERPTPTADLLRELEITVTGAAQFIENKVRYVREDTLWPSSPSVFQSSPIGLQFGSSGPSLFLQQVRGRIPEKTVDWLLYRAEHGNHPAGYFSGLAGLAWLLLEEGRQEQAEALLEQANAADSLTEELGFYYGLSGVATVNLHFWSRLKNEKYLEFATQAGETLKQAAKVADTGVVWSDPEQTPLGLALGPAGISLFLTYLAATSGDDSCLELAQEALMFELSYVQEIGELLLWFPATNSSSAEPKSPHTFFGTAGTGAVLLRAGLLSGNGELLHWAERCGGTVAERYTNKLWYDYGLAGYGEYLLDMYYFQKDKKYWNAAAYLAEAVMLHRFKKPEGYIFLGENHHKFCCDFSMGSAGIGLFLHRVLNPDRGRITLPDHLLQGVAKPQEAHV
ncbi:MAG: class III lanthionine synthetase LanKC [Acidobacteriota bacterium]